jgi:hypothetical protein
MTASITIVNVERDGVDGLIVTFSDGTTGAYVVEELLELRPIRQREKIKTGKNNLQDRRKRPTRQK